MRYSSLPLDQLPSWARLNDVQLHGIVIKSQIVDEHGNDKGGGVVATVDHGPGEVLLTVPSDLVVSRAQVEQVSKIDAQFRDLLEAVGPSFSQNVRKSILLFLLTQVTHSSPDFEGRSIGITTPLTDYVAFLPKSIPLPTFFTAEERELLLGTSLAAAVDQKMTSLEQEFEHLRTSTQGVEWCQKIWWDEVEGRLTLDDWKTVDAIYRSRAVELPETTGDAMVPILDMANHASNDSSNSRFEVDQDGNVMLVVCDNKSVKAGQEITIVYGSGGACEMIFSYGFLEHGMQSARELFLSLSMPPDDPLAVAKTAYAKEAPGVRIYLDRSGQMCWDSPFVWWACVNEEDGLEFKVSQTSDGQRELKATWKGSELPPTDQLRLTLLQDPLKDIFLLRATVIVQQRVELQGARLSGSQVEFDTFMAEGQVGDRRVVMDTVRRLRELELDLLMVSYQSLEAEKTRLLSSDNVRVFLGHQEEPFHQVGGDDQDDFS